jgi:hypothetical protein
LWEIRILLKIGAAMDFLDGFFYAMAAVAAVAAFVDFLLGPPGQEKLRDKLTDWWHWLSEIQWRNFGSREASFAVNVIDKFCGPRLNTWKRLVVSAGIVVILVLSTILIAIIVIPKGPPWQWTSEDGKSMDYFLQSAPVELGLSILFVGISFSIARFLSQWVAKLGDRGSAVWFLLLVFIQLALCIFWPPVMELLRALYTLRLQKLLPWHSHSIWPHATFDLSETLDAMLKDGFVHYYVSYYFNMSRCNDPGCAGSEILDFARHIIDFAGTGLRLLLALFFLASFVLRPLVQRPLELLLRRIIEAGKPPLTLIFGGLAAAAKFVQEGMKHFS